LLYAVVDIETTGGYAAENGITEIGVVVTDGTSVRDTFYTMLNPMTPIPSFIESLTGITNDMVKDLPAFDSVAEELFSLLRDKIFVAHNVNFDFSFIKYHLSQSGFQLEVRKLDTIRLSRHIIPGLKGYGLDKLCRFLKIKINGRHSALGDAMAATEILHELIRRDGVKFISQSLKSGRGEVSLPPNVNEEKINQLPTGPGVYFFHEKSGKVIYVGKARNIKRRVKNHFSNNKPGKQKQEFLKKVYSITFQETATELMAFILEGIEIKKRWPEQNKAQKWREHIYGLYSYIDSAGYQRLFLEKEFKQIKPFCTFGSLTEGLIFLRSLIRDYELCPYLCFLTKSKDDCEKSGYQCHGACSMKEASDSYNHRVEKCIREISERLPSFAILDKGVKPDEKSCILVEKGKFVGMGYVPENKMDMEEMKRAITPYVDNLYVRSLINHYSMRHPYQMFSF